MHCMHTRIHRETTRSYLSNIQRIIITKQLRHFQKYLCSTCMTQKSGIIVRQRILEGQVQFKKSPRKNVLTTLNLHLSQRLTSLSQDKKLIATFLSEAHSRQAAEKISLND